MGPITTIRPTLPGATTSPWAVRAKHLDLSAISGLEELWSLTRGDPRICLALADGSPDLAHPCFAGARLELLEHEWIQGEIEEWGPEHATHIASMLFGQPGSPVEGVAPGCRGLLIPSWRGEHDAISALLLSRIIALAAARKVQVLHLAHCLPSKTGSGDQLLLETLDAALAQNILVVAPAGNNLGECYCFPSAHPGVLAVGALGDDGVPRRFSNHGALLNDHGVMAYGENMLGACPGGGVARQQGTSCATPVVSGVCALLLSLLLKLGREPDVELVRQLVLETALPCSSAESPRCMRGILNIPGILDRLLERPGLVASSGAASAPRFRSTPIFALGGLEVEFPNLTREQEFLRQHKIALGPELLPLLEAQPQVLGELTWILSQDGCPLYALRPGARGPFAQDIYQHLLELKLALADLQDPIERISVPGILTPALQTLRSGQTVPVVHLPHQRGMFGWSTAAMLESVEPGSRRGLGDFLERVYGDLQNPGQRSRDRALNFAATNVFQAAGSVGEALSQGFELHSIEVEKSPFCRLGSDCWEIQLMFQDPENCRRAYRVHSFSIDVSDVMPVTLGSTKTWSVRH